KSFKDNYPLTRCRMTELGRDELESYIQTLKSMLDI
ncbi:MAG: transcriptional regulator, partial [Psychroflexus halocasei]